jgi:GIY-YIG catalytic domain
MMITGFIYKLACNNPDIKDIYVGSTTAMKKRMWNHQYDCDNQKRKSHNLNVYKFIRANGGISNWSMLLLEVVEFTEKKELREQERWWHYQLKATLNTCIPNHSRKEINDVKNKIQINHQCECGSFIKLANHFKRHLNTNKHQGWIKNNNITLQ